MLWRFFLTNILTNFLTIFVTNFFDELFWRIFWKVYFYYNFRLKRIQIIILISLVILIWMTISRLNLMKTPLLPSLKLLKVFSNLEILIQRKMDFSTCNFLGAKYFFFSCRSLKTREKYISFAELVLLSLYIFWGKCVYFSIFEW